MRIFKKKYNTPNVEMLVLQTQDIMVLSVASGAEDDGNPNMSASWDITP